MSATVVFLRIKIDRLTPDQRAQADIDLCVRVTETLATALGETLEARAMMTDEDAKDVFSHVIDGLLKSKNAARRMAEALQRAHAERMEDGA